MPPFESAEGELLISGGEKFHAEIRAVVDGTKQSSRIVCDGKAVRVLAIEGRTRTYAPPGKMGRHLAVVPARGGLFLWLTLVASEEGARHLIGSEVGDVVPGPEQGLRLYLGGTGPGGICSLWVDPDSALPRRHVFRGMDGTFSEEYEIVLDEPLDDGLFTLPE